MSTPEIIYLIPGEDIEGYPGMVWCDDPAPDSCCDPDEAVKYVRADIHESALKRQGNAAKMGMATAHGFITGTAQTLIDEAAKAEGADNA
jgi:hypothetical protein